MGHLHMTEGGSEGPPGRGGRASALRWRLLWEPWVGSKHVCRTLPRDRLSPPRPLPVPGEVGSSQEGVTDAGSDSGWGVPNGGAPTGLTLGSEVPSTPWTSLTQLPDPVHTGAALSSSALATVGGGGSRGWLRCWKRNLGLGQAGQAAESLERQPVPPAGPGKPRGQAGWSRSTQEPGGRGGC